MQYIRIILFLSFFAGILGAEYLREIRIGTFFTNNDAQESLIELNEFKQKHPNIFDLQKKWNFEFKARKSGQYYITLVEPFTDRAVLQEVLNILRSEYKDIYVTKTKRKNISFKEAEKASVSRVDELTEPVLKAEPTEIKKYEPTFKEVSKEKTTERKIEKITDDTNIWQILFFIAIFILLTLLRFFFKMKRENEIYVNSNVINGEKYEQLYINMKDKDRFLSYASHELRTPIKSIIGLTNIVLESSLEKVQKDYIQIIKSSSENLLNIVNDISDITKIQAAELKLEKVEFNINELLEYVLKIIYYQAKNNNVEVITHIDNDVPSYIIGDSLRLGQILINLLDNAVKFTKDGEVVLSIRKSSNYGNSITLEFSISDTGIGMSDSQISEIFNSYSQDKRSTRREFGGTGLGLSISKQLVEMMGGEIKVDSEIGIGTKFTFNSKFKLNDSGDKRPYRLPSVELSDKKVLIVDSADRNIVSLRKKLDYFKCRVHSIPSLEEVILEENSLFDIVIINQAKLTSLAIEKLKELQSRDKSKIVVLGELYGSLNDNILQNFKTDAYLKTPFTQQSILNLIFELYISRNSQKRPKKKIQKDNPLNDTKVQTSNIDDTEFEELTISVGLKWCDNDVEFYKSVLKDFKIMYINSEKVVEELCQNGSFDDARHKAMDIKNAALNIGAYNICEHAATMEYEFEKGHKSNWSKLINLYDESLKKLIIDIDKYLDKV